MFLRPNFQCTVYTNNYRKQPENGDLKTQLFVREARLCLLFPSLSLTQLELMMFATERLWLYMNHLPKQQIYFVHIVSIIINEYQALGQYLAY